MNLFKKASQLRKKNPRLSVPASVKLAAKQMKKPAAKKRVGAVKFVEKGQSANAKPYRVYRQLRTRAGTFKGVQQLSGVLSDAKRLLLLKIGELEAKKFAAKKVSEKKRIAKELAEKKRVYRKLSDK